MITKYGYINVTVISIISLVLFIVSYFVGNFYFRVGLASITLLFLLFTLYFFRDPDRTTPNLDNVIVSPADGSTTLNTDIDVTLSVQNFTVAAAGMGDGHIHYTVDGGSTVMKYDTTPIVLTGLSTGEHTINLQLVDNSHMPLSTPVTATTTFNVYEVQALPFTESFDYTAETSLIDQPLWSDSSTTNLVMVKANDDGGGNPILGNYYSSSDLPDPVGGFVRMQNDGSDPYLGFETVSSGTVYASFLFHITDLSTLTKSAGGYFAILAENNSYRGRIWVKDVDGNGTQFQVGATVGGTSSYYTSFTANTAEPVFIVMAYDLDNDEFKMWVVPDATTFGTNTPPAAHVTDTGATSATINRFILRQDSTTETPLIDFDELRIGTSWKDVTSNPVASVKNNAIEGFATYPNPVTNNRFTVSSSSSDKKQVSIFNVLGKRVLITNFSGISSNIDVSNISSGLYILKVTEGTKISSSKLVIK